MTKDKITDKYIKAVQKQFKHYHTTDARFISNLKDAVISYAAQQDSLDYEQLVSQFGDPQELVNDYFSEQSIDKQKKNVCFTWNIKTICIIITVTDTDNGKFNTVCFYGIPVNFSIVL